MALILGARILQVKTFVSNPFQGLRPHLHQQPTTTRSSRRFVVRLQRRRDVQVRQPIAARQIRQRDRRRSENVKNFVDNSKNLFRRQTESETDLENVAQVEIGIGRFGKLF